MAVMSILRKPPALHSDTLIAVLSPSCWVEREKLDLSASEARDVYGLNMTIHAQCDLRDGNSAGTTAQKIIAFEDVWQDPAIGAVIVARGGSRALHMLNDLNWHMIGKHSKILLGYSDTTVLLNTIYRKAAIPTFHGLHATQFAGHWPRDIIPPTLDFLRGNWKKPLFPTDTAYTILQDGDVTAPLIGGNMSLVYALAASGTDYMPRWQHKILMLEDVEEDIRHIDRMFGALRLQGVFRELKGLVIGQFTGTTDTSNVPFGRTFEDIIAEHVLPDLDGPVILNAPFGHVAMNYPFPIGVPTRLHAENGTVYMQLTESPFAE